MTLAHERPAGEVLYAFLRNSGWLRRLAETDSVANEEALSNIARFFDIVRAQSALLADDRAVFVATPPPDADPGRRRPAHGGHRPRGERGRGHDRPQGEGPRVPGRLPAGPDHRPLPGRSGGASRSRCRSSSVNETLPEGDYQLQEERRLFYVGMTRARDELVLSHAADYGGQRARRVSPFVLEALDLPWHPGRPGPARSRASPLEQLAAFERTEPAPVEPARAATTSRCGSRSTPSTTT